MFDLLDDAEPPPKFTFSGLLALLAASGTLVLELQVGLTWANASPVVVLFLGWTACLQLVGPVVGTLVLCVFAAYFGPLKWPLIALAILCLPSPVTMLVIGLTR